MVVSHGSLVGADVENHALSLMEAAVISSTQCYGTTSIRTSFHPASTLIGLFVLPLMGQCSDAVAVFYIPLEQS